MTGWLARLDRVTCAHGAVASISDVDLVVGRGDFLGIVGPSGAGKSTLLHAILGIHPPSAGTVHRRERLKVGYVPQVETINWQFPVTVEEVVVMARLARRRVPWTTRTERAEVGAVLERLGIGQLGRRHISELSGGQQQRVFIARALVAEPDLLLLDEPTSGVDVRTRHEMLHLLADLNADGLTIVLTTHDLNGLAAHLPKLLCLNRRVIGMGAPEAVLVPDVLERTYGAPMEVLVHGGMRMVVDRYEPSAPRIVRGL